MMKRRRIFWLTLLLVLMPWLTQSAWAVTAAGTVVGLEGRVWAEATQGRRDLKLKDVINAEDEVFTGENGKVQIMFKDDTVLAQGPNGHVRIDKYVYDPATKDNSNILLKLNKGTMRVISGKIAEQNPKRFNMESALSVIGIRGTMTAHVITPEGEIHYALDLTTGHLVSIRDRQARFERILRRSGMAVDFIPGQPPGEPRKASIEELKRIGRDTSPKGSGQGSGQGTGQGGDLGGAPDGASADSGPGDPGRSSGLLQSFMSSGVDSAVSDKTSAQVTKEFEKSLNQKYSSILLASIVVMSDPELEAESGHPFIQVYPSAPSGVQTQYYLGYSSMFMPRVVTSAQAVTEIAFGPFSWVGSAPLLDVTVGTYSSNGVPISSWGYWELPDPKQLFQLTGTTDTLSRTDSTEDPPLFFGLHRMFYSTGSLTPEADIAALGAQRAIGTYSGGASAEIHVNELFTGYLTGTFGCAINFSTGQVDSFTIAFPEASAGFTGSGYLTSNGILIVNQLDFAADTAGGFGDDIEVSGKARGLVYGSQAKAVGGTFEAMLVEYLDEFMIFYMFAGEFHGLLTGKTDKPTPTGTERIMAATLLREYGSEAGLNIDPFYTSTPTRAGENSRLTLYGNGLTGSRDRMDLLPGVSDDDENDGVEMRDVSIGGHNALYLPPAMKDNILFSLENRDETDILAMGYTYYGNNPNDLASEDIYLDNFDIGALMHERVYHVGGQGTTQAQISNLISQHFAAIYSGYGTGLYYTGCDDPVEIYGPFLALIDLGKGTVSNASLKMSGAVKTEDTTSMVCVLLARGTGGVNSSGVFNIDFAEVTTPQSDQASTAKASAYGMLFGGLAQAAGGIWTMYTDAPGHERGVGAFAGLQAPQEPFNYEALGALALIYDGTAMKVENYSTAQKSIESSPSLKNASGVLTLDGSLLEGGHVSGFTYGDKSYVPSETQLVAGHGAFRPESAYTDASGKSFLIWGVWETDSGVFNMAMSEGASAMIKDIHAVTGRVTSTADLDRLRSGKVTATYNGEASGSYGYAEATTASVNSGLEGSFSCRIDFGTSTVSDANINMAVEGVGNGMISLLGGTGEVRNNGTFQLNYASIATPKADEGYKSLSAKAAGATFGSMAQGVGGLWSVTSTLKNGATERAIGSFRGLR